jgi:hypothetical protein
VRCCRIRSGSIRQGSVTGQAAKRPDPHLKGGKHGIEKAHREGGIPQTDVTTQSGSVDIFNCDRQPNQHDCDCDHIRGGLAVLVCGEAVFVTPDAEGTARDPKLFAADHRDVSAPGNICLRRGSGSRLTRSAEHSPTSERGPRRHFLALQLPFARLSESMGNHDSNIVDADSVD